MDLFCLKPNKSYLSSKALLIKDKGQSYNTLSFVTYEFL